jgi:hypothetical protein
MTTPTAAEHPTGPDGPIAPDSPAAPATAAPATATATPAGTPAAPGAKPRKPRSWRWLRLVVPPLAVLLVVLLGTWIYQLEQPDLEDGAYLSPTSRADIGGAALADRVRAAGVSVERVTKSSDALVAAYEGNATLLVTTPQLVHMYYLRMLKLLPSTTKVVLVEPDLKTIINGLLPLMGTDRALVSEVSGPGCTFAPAAQAGSAGVRRTRYGRVDEGRELARCYDDSLVVFTRGSTQITVVGSADPFRNDRIDENNNAKLVTGLLTGAPKLIWLDLHRREPPPLVNEDPALAGDPAAPPSLRPRSSGEPVDPEFPVKGGNDTGGQPAGGGGSADGGGGGDPPNPLWQAFPPWVYVASALVALIFVMLALAQARRLGAPVVEPLPVAVRASETVSGRGRLYQRAKARAESLQTLRDSALARLIRLLRLEPDVDRRTMIETVAAQSGWPAPLVDQVLFGAPPQDDAELVHAAVRLEQLVNAVATEKPVAAAHAPAAAPEGESR